MPSNLRPLRGGGLARGTTVTREGTVGRGRRGRFRVAAALASGAVLATAGLAAVVPGSVTAPASARSAVTATSSKVTCTKRTAVQPPPKGMPGAMPERGKTARTTRAAAATIKPVCPLGEVPVLHSVAGPKGNPDQARQKGTGGRALAGPRRRSGPDAACNGTFEDGYCYYWAGATDFRTDQGGGHTMTVEKPAVTGSGHSLEEMSVQAGPDYGNIVEIGWIVNGGSDPDPQLFVFHWLGWKPTCYDGCGFVQYSNTYYPGMDLSALVGQSVYNGYVYYQGNWWAWFNDQWVGYFPGSLWDGQFPTSQQVQWFGEVATNNGVPPLNQMGDGLPASNPSAAPMSTLCDVDATAWVCFYYDQQSLYQTDPEFYSVAHTGFGAIRLGGPGS